MLEAALDYAEMGWLVLACEPHEKMPLRLRLPSGVYDATDDAEKIRAWFRDFPDANVGVRCGACSGIVVLDVDPRNGGSETLAALIAEHGPLPDTVTCSTGGGGVHFYFAHPGHALSSWKQSGLELKAENVYVVAPPSIHPSGPEYRWAVGPRDGTRLAKLPAFLVRPKRERPELKARLTVPETPEGKWAASALAHELAELDAASPGNRNNQLNISAFNLGQVVASGFLSRVVVENGLFDAAATNGSLAEDGEFKVRGTIRSGLDSGAKTPRYPRGYAPGPASRPARLEVSDPLVGLDHDAPVEYLDLSIEPPSPEWIVDGWLAKHDIGIISAAAGAGKSTLVADLAVAISHNRPWCSSLPVRFSGPALYFDEEQSRGTLQRLFRGLGGQNGRGLYVSSCQGMNLSSAEGRTRLEREIDRLRPALVVLDTVAQVFAGVDLSSLEEVSTVFRGLFRLRGLFDTAFVLPTHNRKASRERGVTLDPLEQVFGSIGFGGNVDTVWNARQVGNSLEVSQSKRRDNERGKLSMVVGYDRSPEGHITLTCEGSVAAADSIKDQAELLVVEILDSGRTVKLAELVSRGGENGHKESTVRRAVEHLLAVGRIDRPAHGK